MNVSNLIPLHLFGVVASIELRGNVYYMKAWQEAESLTRPWEGVAGEVCRIRPGFISFIKQRVHENNCAVRDRILFDGHGISDAFREALISNADTP